MSSRKQKMLALAGLIVTISGGLSLFMGAEHLGVAALLVGAVIGICGAILVLSRAR